MTREISIRNAHPRLRFSRPAMAKAIAVLDAHFEILSGDLPHLTLSRSRLRDLKSKIENQKSKITGGCPPGELSVVLLTDPALAKVHADFMGDPSATDVITFAGDAIAGLAGEICVSVDTAARYVGLPLVGRPARRQAPALQESFSAELTLYVVHGWLHLAGYDDLRSAKKRRMRAAEARAMKLLSTAKAVPTFRLK